MKSGTRFFLLAGCALVLGLDAPGTLGLLEEAWLGPYSSAADWSAAEAGMGTGVHTASARPVPALSTPDLLLLALVRF